MFTSQLADNDENDISQESYVIANHQFHGWIDLKASEHWWVHFQATRDSHPKGRWLVSWKNRWNSYGTPTTGPIQLGVDGSQLNDQLTTGTQLGRQIFHQLPHLVMQLLWFIGIPSATGKHSTCFRMSKMLHPRGQFLLFQQIDWLIYTAAGPAPAMHCLDVVANLTAHHCKTRIGGLGTKHWRCNSEVSQVFIRLCILRMKG